MSLRKRNVKIKLPIAEAGQIIKITLVNWSAYDDFVLPPRREEIATDEQGEAIANLWANADGLSATYYRVELPSNLENHSNPPLFFNLEYDDGSDVDLSEILIDGLPETNDAIVNIFSSKIGKSEISILGLPHISNIEKIRIYAGNLSAGTNDIYTVPTGKRLYAPFFLVANPNAGASVLTFYKKNNGIFFRLFNAFSAAANNSVISGTPFIFEEGETFTLLTALAGVSITGVGFLLPSNSMLKSAQILNLTGQTALYTVPTGKQAQLLPHFTISPQYGGGVFFTNTSGATVTYKIYFVPNGQTLGNQHQLLSTNVATNGQFRMDNLPPFLTAGDKIVLETSSAATGQFAIMSLVETDA